MTEPTSPLALTEPEVETLVAKLDAWAATLSAKEALTLLRVLAHADESAPADVQGFDFASEIAAWEAKLNAVGDDAQLANVDLQNMLQKQQQTLQMLSNISLMLHNTATSVIRKIGG